MVMVNRNWAYDETLEAPDDPLSPESPEPHVVPPASNPMGVARKLVDDLYTDIFGLVLRTHRGDFYRWDGACWPEAEARGIRGAMYEYLEGAVYEIETKAGIEQVPWNPTRRKVDDVLDALRAVTYLDGSIEPPSWLNGDKLPASEIVSMSNGLLHLPTRRIFRHTPDYWVLHSLPFDYDPFAPYPSRWQKFLDELWENDPESVSALQEIVGYLISGDTSQQKIFLLVGPRRSGKGTIGRVLTGLLGRFNVGAPTLAGLSTNFGLQVLIDKPLALISDARLSTKADAGIVVERLLSISGEDSITVDRKYRDPWTGRLPSRFLILTNELPRLSDSSGALASRFIMLVLTRSFLGEENPALTDELLEEAPGILNWGLEGLDRLTARGYSSSPSREQMQSSSWRTSPLPCLPSSASAASVGPT
jgi:putative DNA primase/helicase